MLIQWRFDSNSAGIILMDWIKIALFILILFALECGKNSSDRSERNQVTITYWSANDQYEINLAKNIIARWEKIHPDIRIKHQPIPESRSSEEVILAAIVGGTTPDVYSNMWPGDCALYVKAQALLPLSQFSDFDSLASSRYASEILEEARFTDGHVYQILWKTNPIMMMYNKNIFARFGIDEPPRTYDDYLKAAEKISRDTNGDGYIDRWMGITQILVTWWQRFFDYYTLYIAASGGNTLLDNNGIIFDGEASVKVFQFLKTLFENNYFPKERMDARADVFIHEIVATRFTGPWATTQVEKFKPEGFEYDFAPVPRPQGVDGPTFTYGDYKSIVIFSNTKHPEASWEFVKFLISEQSDLELLHIANQLPLRKNILQNEKFQPYFEQNPKMKIFANQAKFVKGVDNSPVLREIFDAISHEFEACVIYGTKSPEDAIRDAAARAKLVMD